jgi:3-ketoacyl-CoA synthase
VIQLICACRPKDARRAKYELLHSVRTHLGNEDEAFLCMGNGEDVEGKEGVFLRKTVIATAGRALKKNLTTLAPYVLPWSELVSAESSGVLTPDHWVA